MKAVGNYVPGMLPSGVAKKQGYAEVIYLDAAEEKYIEEVGAANFFAIFGNKLVTPSLTGSILPGITLEIQFYFWLKTNSKWKSRREELVLMKL